MQWMEKIINNIKVKFRQKVLYNEEKCLFYKLFFNSYI